MSMVVAQQYPQVRRLMFCCLCGLPKNKDLLLCWPCHDKQKRQHDGGYSRDTERVLERLETLFGTGRGRYE